MEDIKYLLSPQDLMAVELVPELITGTNASTTRCVWYSTDFCTAWAFCFVPAGVSTFKIEGRLKGPVSGLCFPPII